MRNAALRFLHILGDLAPEPNHLDAFVLPPRPGSARGGGAAEEQMGVEMGVPAAVAAMPDRREVDAETARARATRGGRERLGLVLLGGGRRLCPPLALA